MSELDDARALIEPRLPRPDDMSMEDWENYEGPKVWVYSWNYGAEIEYLNPLFRAGIYVIWCGMFRNFLELGTQGYNIGRITGMTSRYSLPPQIHLQDCAGHECLLSANFPLSFIGAPSQTWIDHYARHYEELGVNADLCWYRRAVADRAMLNPADKIVAQRYGLVCGHTP